MQSFQIKHSSKSLCAVYVLVRQVDTGQTRRGCTKSCCSGGSFDIRRKS